MALLRSTIDTCSLQSNLYIGRSEKERCMWENDRCGGVQIEFVQRPQKLKDRCGKTIHPGTVNQGFVVHYAYIEFLG
jgi:hypothetical protein